LSLILGLLVGCSGMAGAGETNTIRLAVGPFFAPPGDTALERAASQLSDLLAALLPQANRFQLVERDKVQGIWDEMNLAQAGLASPNNAVKPGHVLSCDWLVSGTFVKTGTGPQIWVKLIRTQDSVVMDMQSVPYVQSNLSTTTGAIADFLAQAITQTRPREFIAMGKFDDWSITTTREDWSQRLVAMLETNFLATGYGVVERDAVAPIFSEYQFQTAELTGIPANRVRLKPAFWIVDGGCKWIHTTQDEVSVSIRIRKMGGGEQVLSLTQPPGEALEKAVLETVQSGLTNLGSMTLEQALAGEQNVRSEMVGQLMDGRRSELSPLRYSTNRTFIKVTNARGETRQLEVNPALQGQRQQRMAERTKALQQAILLNPKDMSAKFMLGLDLFGRPDPAESKEGEELLAEVAASGDPIFAIRAKNWMADIKSGRITLDRKKFGMTQLVTHGQPASLPPQDTRALAQAIPNLRAKTDLLYAPQIVATPSESVVKIPTSAFTESAHYAGITAAKLWNRVLFIACGTTLHAYDLDARKSHEVGLPIKLKQAISAIEAEDGVLWLGTGDGLFRVSLADGNMREFTEKDGFPAPAITALRLAGGRLLVGFSGALGYLDTGSGKFTGLMGALSLHNDWQQDNLEPPSTRIHAMITLDGNNFWVASDQHFQHFDFGANKWEAATPLVIFQRAGFLADPQIAVNSKYVLIKDLLHCFAARRQTETNWWTVSLRANSDGDESSALALDPAMPDRVWIGDDNGAINLVDLATLKITASGQVPRNPTGLTTVQWIFPTADTVLFLVGQGNGVLRCLDKSALFDPTRAVTSAPIPVNEGAKLAARSGHPLAIRENPGMLAELHDGPITACAIGRAFNKGQLLVACGTQLNSYDWSGVFGYDFDQVELPVPVEYPITAIASDDRDLWLGTDGGGLMRIPKSGAAATVFNEKNGFPRSAIRSLALTPGRLFIGFSQGMDGSMGWLDLNTLQFTGTQAAGISLKVDANSLLPPPRHAVWQIKSPDNTNTFWMASEAALYRLNFAAQQWSLQLPRPDQPDVPRTGGIRTLATVGNYVATACAAGGVAIYEVAGDQWTHLDLSTNPIDNEVTTLAMDYYKPGYLWLGGHGKITILNMKTRQIVGEYRMAFFDGVIEEMVVYSGDIFFIEEKSGTHELYHWLKPALEP